MPTHYELLNILSTTNDATVKWAYHKLVLVTHPDKTLHLDPVERSRREKLFEDANTAFEILSDAPKRAAYDRGLRARARIPANSYSNRPTASAQAEAKRRQERDERSHQYTNPSSRPPPPPPPHPPCKPNSPRPNPPRRPSRLPLHQYDTSSLPVLRREHGTLLPTHHGSMHLSSKRPSEQLLTSRITMAGTSLLALPNISDPR